MTKLGKDGFNLDKKSDSKIDLEKGKEKIQQAADDVNENMEEMVDEVRDSVPVEDAPADIEYPKPEKELKKALETGDIDPPRKKNYAWLWALIGIAIVIAFIAMLLRSRGESSPETSGSDAPAMFISGDSASDSVVGTEDEPAAESAQSVVGVVENVASEASSSVSEMASGAAGKVENAVKDATSKVEGMAAGVSNAASEVSGSVETAAQEVIKGDFGNGNVRKERLGARYQEIQNMVNQMKRQGKF